MGIRGRKSSAALQSVPRIGPDAIPSRPSAPEAFNAREREIWNQIVSSLAVDWFQPGDLPLLHGYVKACRYFEDVSVECDKAIAAGQFVVETNAGSESVNPIFKLQDLALNQMARIAVKLRLTQSAKWTETKAATNLKKGNASKLWA